MKVFQYLLIGIPTLALLLSIVMGPTNALFLIFLSIVCTAGAGLVFWIPVCIVLGFIVSTILGFVKSGDQISHVGNEEQAIKTYANSMKDWGFSPTEVKQRLLEQGWNKDTLENYL